jgi:hypothetical protein
MQCGAISLSIAPVAAFTMENCADYICTANKAIGRGGQDRNSVDVARVCLFGLLRFEYEQRFAPVCGSFGQMDGFAELFDGDGRRRTTLRVLKPTCAAYTRDRDFPC